MTRVVFMGTPEFAVPSLQKLVQTQDVVGVVTQPDRPAGRGRRLQMSAVKRKAVKLGLPVYQPPSLRSEEAARPLRAWDPEVIVVAAFGQILRPHVLELPLHGCLNVHASLLPRWRGASPIQHTILAGDEESGISIMRMDEGLDTGPVYVQEAIEIWGGITAKGLHDRLAKLGASSLGHHLDAILAGELAAVPQDDSLATYAPLIKKEDGRIGWDQASAHIDRLVRAMTPWPGAFTTWQGRRLKVLRAEIRPGRARDEAPGFVWSDPQALAVVTGDGALHVHTMQMAGGRAMNGIDFVRGHPELLGAVLGEAGEAS